MKKLFISLVLGASVLLTLFGCGKIESVKLLSFSQYQPKKSDSAIQKRAYIMRNAIEYDLNGYQYIVVKQGIDEFDLTILLDNPNDYHIFDFKLTCDDEDAMLLIDSNYQLISTLDSINWKGDTNKEYTIHIKSTTNEFLRTISLTNIYYSDRETSTNHYEVDLNNKQTVKIYKVYDGFTCKFTRLENNKLYYTLTLVDTHIDLESIKLNNESITLVDNKYTFEALGEYNLTYNYILDDVMYEYNLTYTASLEDALGFKPNCLRWEWSDEYQHWSLYINLSKEFKDYSIDIYDKQDIVIKDSIDSTDISFVLDHLIMLNNLKVLVYNDSNSFAITWTGSKYMIRPFVKE